MTHRLKPPVFSFFSQNGIKCSFIAGAVSACLAPAVATAQNTSSNIDDTLIVSATRTQNRFDEVGSSVSVILAETIEARQYASAADVLRDAAGVTIARNGSFGGVASARIRGASSGQTLIVIDGVVMNDASAPQGGFNFANLDVADIDRIEVLRGPQSLLYGADAIGGVISITTKKAGSGLNAYLEGGARGTIRGGASATLGDDAAYGRLTISGARTDGISKADVGVERDAYRSIASSLSGGIRLRQSWNAELSGRYADSHAEIDGFPPPLFSLNDTEETEDTREFAIAGRVTHDHSTLDGALTISYNDINRENLDRDVQTFAGEGDRFSADYIGAFTVSEKTRLLFGGEVERTSVAVSGVDESANAGAVFALAEVKPVGGLTLSIGSRRDEFSNFDGATTARVAAAWATPGDWIFRASWGQGFRAPTLFELNFNQFGTIPNPNLQAERANGFDVGIEKRITSGDVSALFRTTFFHTKVDDQIDFDFAGSGYFNIDETRSRGVEVESDWAIGKHIAVNLSYSFIDAIDRQTGLQLLRQPKHSSTAVVTLTPIDQLAISTSLIFNGKENDFPAANDSFFRADLRAAYTLSPSLELYGRVENIFDTDYQDVSGYGEPGLSAFGGIRVTL